MSKQVSVQAGGVRGGEGLGTIILRCTLETPLCSRHSLLALFFWKKTRERVKMYV